MPKSIYKAVMQGNTPYASAPIILDFNAGTAIETNREDERYLLCNDCEQLFSKSGEDVVCGQCHKKDGKFVLAEILKGMGPSEVAEDRSKFYYGDAVQNKIDVEAYAYFALSVLWRGSIARWSNMHDHYFGSLGQKYEKEFEAYLLGAGDFPVNVQVVIMVDFDREPLTAAGFPACKRGSLQGYECFNHFFIIPGMKFMIRLGGNIGRINRRIAKDISAKVLFYEWSFQNSGDWKGLRRRARRLEEKGGLAKKNW